jgi:hypothetical protein
MSLASERDRGSEKKEPFALPDCRIARVWKAGRREQI